MNTRAHSLTAILVCGSVIVTLAMGIRHGLGLFLQPMSADFGWNREVFSFAIALQNLLWGAAHGLGRGPAYLFTEHPDDAVVVQFGVGGTYGGHA